MATGPKIDAAVRGGHSSVKRLNEGAIGRRISCYRALVIAVRV
jgi:hypothetical protein